MSRPLRIQYPNAAYHVINRGIGRCNIFLDNRDRRNFLNLIHQAWKRWKIELFAYCLMGNHYHLCFRTPEATLSRIMRHINGLYTQRFNRFHKRDGPLFRGRYKAMVIEEQEYLAQVVRYIHLNPVKASIVKNPKDYLWSSHWAYFQPKKSPSWLAIKKLGEWFGSPHKFHEFVIEGNDKFIENIYMKKKWPIILGNQYFMENLRKKKVNIKTKDHLREELEYIRPSVEEVLGAVKREYGVNLTGLIKGERGQSNEARKVAIWMVREKCDYPYQKIAGIFGIGTAKTISWACREVEQLLKKKRTFQRITKIGGELNN